MDYAEDIKHDVFVSYAHSDDIPERWVTTLVRNLQESLASRLGRADAYSIWMDRNLIPSHPIPNAITENLERSSTLLVVLSPAYLNSEWCRREANHFLETIRRTHTSDQRVFIVEMRPTERSQWPAEFRDLVSLPLWEHTNFGGVATLGFPQPSEFNQAYYSALAKLADGIAVAIQRVRQLLIGGDQSSPPSIRPPRLSSELDQRRESGDYDVFLCHNTEDKSEVKKIGGLLIEEKILPWLDEWDIRPGVSWQTALEDQIESIKSAAVFVGESGFGPWQNLELEAFLREFARRRCPVIPVVLQSCKHPPRLPTFLRGLQWVDFRLREPEPLPRLVWGVTGKRRRMASSSGDA